MKDVKKLRSRQILVGCCKKASAENLCANSLAGLEIKASPHPTLNYCKGVIRTRELNYVEVEEDEIAQEL